VHLAALPFGVPNFNEIIPLAAGTYPTEAADLDKFLYTTVTS